MKYRLAFAAALLMGGVPASAQVAATAQNVPDLPYEAVPNFFHGIPPGEYLGELQGIATNSKGDTFAFFRGPNTRLWQFDRSGKFVKEIGKDFYGFMFAHSVRVDRHDNIWTVDEGTNVVTKFDPTGTKVLMVLGHSSCGAVKASISAKAVPGQISSLYRYIRPAVDAAHGDVEGSIKANARIQAKLLRDSSPVIADAIKAGSLQVVAAYYDLASGKVALLD